MGIANNLQRDGIFGQSDDRCKENLKNERTRTAMVTLMCE